MIGVLVGFAVIAAVIAIGYVVGRTRILGPSGQHVLSRIAFFVLSPCLLFTVLADADAHDLFSSLLLVSVVAAVAVFALFVVISRVFWRRSLPETVIGSLASGYVNANNIGIPVAVYVVGDASVSAPVILLQLIVFAPVALTILDIQERGRTSLGRVVLQPFRNPIIVGSLLGLILSVTGIALPDPVMEPFRLIGAAAVPVVLISFGISLHGQRVLRPGSGRKDVLLASGLKLVVMPIVAWAFAWFVLGMRDEALFVAVLLAALPTGQNVFNYAQRYGRGEILARDTALVTTIGSIGALVVVAALLAP
ncbi:AEC family transporter [Okibacterium endophyticum]